jgi:hypothetical protein
MKKLFGLAIFALFLTTSVNAQEFKALDKSPLDAVMARNDNDEGLIRVIYSRPHKKGREIFGNLVPYGKIWRTGANEATEVTFYKDMMVGGKKVPKGAYTLYTIPNKKEWTIILNKNTNVWGTRGNYKESEDLVRITAPARQAANTIEDFSMAFQPMDNGTKLMMGWDDVYVSVPFKNAN